MPTASPINQTDSVRTDLHITQDSNAPTKEELITTIRALELSNKELMEHIFVNIPINDTSTQKLIKNTNLIVLKIKSHYNHDNLEQLLSMLVGQLNQHCNDLMPLASGNYTPHHGGKVGTELVHEGTHILEHLIHKLSSAHAGASILHTVGEGLPIFGSALKLYEIWSDHQKIHEAHHMVGLLRKYSDMQRNTLYKYIIASTLINLSTRISNVPTDHPDTKTSRAAGNALTQWFAFLLTESITSLSSLHESEDINDVAHNWSKSIITKFIPHGIPMPNTNGEIQAYIFDKNELAIAFRIQGIFTRLEDTESRTYLSSLINDFTFDFHRKIYQEVLLPYNDRVNSTPFFSLFARYWPETSKLLKSHQARLVHAFHVIRNELKPLENQEGSNYTIQLSLINNCLVANLQKMCTKMTWHHEARDFLIKEAPSGYSFLEEPLNELADGRLEIRSPEVKLRLAEKELKRERESHQVTINKFNVGEEEIRLLKDRVTKLEALNQPSAANQPNNGNELPRTRQNPNGFFPLERPNNPENLPGSSPTLSH